MVQQSCGDDIQANIEKLKGNIRKCAEQGAQLVVLQELHNSVYFCKHEEAQLCDLAEPIPGPSTETFGALAKELGIVVKNAVGYSTTSVAETTIASALALARNIVYFDEYFHDGRYAKADRAFCYDRLTFEIRGKRWGIIGLGNIGREVARLASAFGCEVRYFSTSGAKREEAYPAMELNELLEWSDILSVHSPLNERTRGLIGREELKRMKPSAMIINVARGGIIDEAALAEALDNGWVSAAALDVFSVEPLRESPLYNIKDRYRLLGSPHNAWAASEAIDRLIDCVAENIRTFLEK